MSSLEFNLKALIAKATEEYTNIATKDPVLASEDDETARGAELDRILEEQEKERKELWDQLYALEEQHVEKKRNVVVGSSVRSDRKELLKLMTLDQQLVRKVTSEMSNINIIEREEEAITDIKFREKLQIQNEQLQETIEFIKKDLITVLRDKEKEKNTLRECKKVGEDLKQRLEKLEEATDVNSIESARAELLALKKKYEVDIKDMSDFLDAHYPVHPVDGAGPLGDECELKIIVEQLLNQAFQHPENPYLPLVPGTYWTPYIQTLIKAGVAKYHPEDSQLICLEDFRLS